MMTLVLIAMAGAAVLIQVSLPFAFLPVDLMFLTCVFAGLQRGRGSGLLLGVFGGLFLDALVGPRLGPRLVSLAVVGALADSLSHAANREQPRLQAAFAAMLSMAHDLTLFFGASMLSVGQGGGKRFLFDYALPRLAVHALLAIPFYFAFRAVVRARVFQDPLSRPPTVIRKLPR